MLKMLVLIELASRGIPREITEFIVEKFKGIVLDCFDHHIPLTDTVDIVIEKMDIFKCSSCSGGGLECLDRKARYILGHEQIFDTEIKIFFQARLAESNPEPESTTEELPASVLAHRFSHFDN